MHPSKIYCIKCKKHQMPNELTDQKQNSASSNQDQTCQCRSENSLDSGSLLKDTGGVQPQLDRSRPSAAQELFFYGSVLAAFGLSMALSFLVIMRP